MAKDKKIFNQSMLDKISSPDQLDKLIEITSLPVWLFILAGFFIVLVTLIWSLTGSLNITTTAEGIFIPDTCSYTYTSAQEGIVKKVFVKKGDSVETGDVLFELDNSFVDKTIEDLEDRRADVASVTLYSSNDKVTEDNSELLNIKAQMMGNGVESKQTNVSISAYQSELNKLNKSLSTAQTAMNTAKSEYESAYQNFSSGLITQTQLEGIQQKYTDAKTNYSTISGKIDSIKQQIASLETQKKSIKIAENSTANIYKKQFDATKAGILSSLDKQIEDSKKLKEDNSVKAKSKGTIIDIKVSPGSAVPQGSEYVTIRNEDNSDHIIQCYVPIQSGKNITEGMAVIVYPTSISRQEYGHMEATVISVDDYITTEQDMREMLGDTNLASSYIQKGPVMGVKCKLRTDKTTESGFYWSSKKGRTLVLADATVVQADIIVKKERPIERLIPYLKEKAYEFTTPQENGETK